jgi:hypothetical protein
MQSAVGQPGLPTGDSYLQQQPGHNRDQPRVSARLRSKPSAAVIGAFPEGETGAAFEAYTAAANALRGDYDFGHTTDASLLAEAKGA